MSRRRRNTSSPEPGSESDEASELLSSSPPAAKRRRPSPSLYIDEDDVEVNTNEQPRLHQASGQVNAFPGLGPDDGDGDGDLFYGPALNGIDYLRMVRSEAKGVPSLLRAAAADADAVGVGVGVDADLDPDSTSKLLLSSSSSKVLPGRYYDGIYTAEAEWSEDVPTLPSAQTRYYETLVAQFRLVQATLRCTPPLQAVESLGDLRPISFPRGSATARRAWQRHVSRFDPHPVQIACMDVASVFVLLDLLRRMLVSQGIGECTEHQRRRLGAWIWAVVGKCPHRGELGSEEIATLRELANAAARIGKGEGVCPDTDGDEDHDDDDDDEEDGMNEIDDVIEAALQARAVENKQSQLGETDSSTALVDMTLTIVGEVYGQRDLLDLRPVWHRAESTEST